MRARIRLLLSARCEARRRIDRDDYFRDVDRMPSAAITRSIHLTGKIFPFLDTAMPIAERDDELADMMCAVSDARDLAS
jgi:hypothetical protein